MMPYRSKNKYEPKRIIKQLAIRILVVLALFATSFSETVKRRLKRMYNNYFVKIAVNV